MSVFVRVALDHPLPTLFDYRYDLAPTPLPGMLVRCTGGDGGAPAAECVDPPAKHLETSGYHAGVFDDLFAEVGR